ncbi:hypothetical protein O3P69_016873 [Scylla paramamosain]|uniref:Uncharacterized protein n=1 Tax=Scylla paramamosain TaxID=85552 RepID=A0AAW0SZU5_SCYPA
MMVTKVLLKQPSELVISGEWATQLVLESRGEPPKKRQKRVYKNLQTRMKNLCQDRRDGRKSVEEFLHGAGHNIRWKS